MSMISHDITLVELIIIFEKLSFFNFIIRQNKSLQIMNFSKQAYGPKIEENFGFIIDDIGAFVIVQHVFST